MLINILISLGAIFIALVFWAMAKSASDEDDFRDELLQINKDAEHRSNILSDLELDTVKKLKAEFSTLYTVNKDRNITIGECEDKFLAFGQRYIISNGKVIGIEA